METTAKTRQQMASEYGICCKTFSKWLKQNKIILPKGLITPKRQEMIYEKIGVPKNSQTSPNLPVNSK